MGLSMRAAPRRCVRVQEIAIAGVTSNRSCQSRVGTSERPLPMPCMPRPAPDARTATPPPCADDDRDGAAPRVPTEAPVYDGSWSTGSVAREAENGGSAAPRSRRGGDARYSSAMTQTASLDSLDVIGPDTYAENGYPHAAWKRLRRESPVHWFDLPNGVGYWAVTRRKDIVWISKQPERFLNAARLAIF